MALPAPLIAFLFDAGKTLIDRIFPDKEKQAKERAEAELALLQLTQSERMADKAQETQLALAQIDVNKEEAKSASLFVAGWRPAIGWVCALTFGYTFLAGPFLTQISSAYGYSFPLPPIDMDNMLYVLGGMLGLGGLRTYEKLNKVAR
jgi:hypothetical protein